MQPEHLFLLEFLVDSVNIQWQGGTNLAGQTVVTFQFLNFQKQEICETVCPGECPGTIQKFESGKSCLFSIPELQSCLDELIITVGVFKKQPPGILPEILEVGKAKIDLTNEFAAVLKDIGEKPNETPASRAIKDDFILYIPGSRDPIGSIRLFIRFSCFGKSIVTGFSLGHSGQSYLFKAPDENGPGGDGVSRSKDGSQRVRQGRVRRGQRGGRSRKDSLRSDGAHGKVRQDGSSRHMRRHRRRTERRLSAWRRAFARLPSLRLRAQASIYGSRMSRSRTYFQSRHAPSRPPMSGGSGSSGGGGGIGSSGGWGRNSPRSVCRLYSSRSFDGRRRRPGGGSSSSGVHVMSSHPLSYRY